MKIQKKLLLGFGSVIFLIAVVTIIFWETVGSILNSFQGLMNVDFVIAKSASSVVSSLNISRKAESDFLRTKDLAYIEIIEKNFEELKTSAEIILKVAIKEKNKRISQSAQKIIDQGNIYEERLSQVVESSKEKGLSKDLGLWGEFRKSADLLGRQMSDHRIDELYQAFLRMWICEREFLHSGYADDKAALEKSIKHYESLLGETGCIEEIKNIQLKEVKEYKNAFNELSDDEFFYAIMQYSREKIEHALNEAYIPMAGELFLQIRMHEKNFLLTADAKEKEALFNASEKLVNQLKNAGIRQSFLDAALNELNTYLDSFKALAKEEEIIRSAVNSMETAAKAIEKEAFFVYDFSVKNFDKRNSQVASKAVFTSRIAGIAGFGAMLLGLFLAVVITRSITNPLKNMIFKIQDLAEGEGDLRTRIDIETKDETGELAKWINKFIGQLQIMVRDIVENSSLVTTASKDFLTIANEMEERAESTQKLFGEVSGATDEMNILMKSISCEMEDNSSSINMAATATEEMSSTIEEIAGGTEKAKTVTEHAVVKNKEVNRFMNELADATEEISKMSEAITEISEQTNLLALNASIEAARAGSAGKGFGVVANEIKVLAGQTKSTTEDIESKIMWIKKSVGDASVGLSEITGIISQIESIVSNISLSIEQQTATTNEIAGNMNQVSQSVSAVNSKAFKGADFSSVIAENVLKMTYANKSLKSKSSKVKEQSVFLEKLSSKLKNQVGRFKV